MSEPEDSPQVVSALRLGWYVAEIRGRNREPSACVIDSQIVKCAGTVPKKTSGYHGCV